MEKQKIKLECLQYFKESRNGKRFLNACGKMPLKIVKTLKGDYKIYNVVYNGKAEKRLVYHNYNDFEKFILNWLA